MKTLVLPVINLVAPLGARRLSRGWLIALAILCFAGALRLTNLGKHGFWTGELFHVFAAKSFIENRTLEVPLWGDYTDARPVTLLTAASMALFGESEFSARLPFVAVNLAFLAFSFAAVRRLFSTKVALVYLFIAAFSPMSVSFSREVRMFGPHQMFYFASAVSFLIGYEDLWRTSQGAGLGSYRFDFRWLAASAVFAAAAWVLHPITVTLMIVLPSYLLAMTVAVWGGLGWRRAVISKYALGLVLMVAVVGVWNAFMPGRLAGLLRETSTIYEWQLQLGHGKNFYRYLLTDQYPGLLFVYPVGVYAAVRRYGRRGFFFTVAFLPLVVILSLLVDRKAERYLMHIFPFFAVIAAAAIAPLAAWARDSFRVHFASRPVRHKLVSMALFAPAVLLFAHPWLESSLRLPFRARNPDWKSIDNTFKAAVSGGVVVTPNPREFLYYFHRYPDYFRSIELRSDDMSDPGLVTNPEAFHDAVMRGRDVYFLGAEWNFHNDALMTQDMRNSVLYNMAPADHGGDRRILAYHRS